MYSENAKEDMVMYDNEEVAIENQLDVLMQRMSYLIDAIKEYGAELSELVEKYATYEDCRMNVIDRKRDIAFEVLGIDPGI